MKKKPKPKPRQEEKEKKSKPDEHMGSGIQELVWMPANKLEENPLNWRIHNERQVKSLAASIEQNGWSGALLYNKNTSRLIDGHGRKAYAIKLAAKLKTKTNLVPVLLGYWTEEQERSLLASLDPISAMAEIDTMALRKLTLQVDEDLGSTVSQMEEQTKQTFQVLIKELESQSLAVDSGSPASFFPSDEEEFGENEEYDGPNPEPQIDRATELQAEWKTETGQLWLIGDHRLLCGDATKGENVRRLMGGTRAYLMATDPPYGVDFKGAKYNHRAKKWAGIEGDQIQGRELTAWLLGCLQVWLPVMAPESAFYIWTAAMEEGAAAATAIRAVGLHIQSQLIWNKNSLVLGQADYHWKHENCWYGFWKGKHHRWYGERDKTTVWDVSRVANSAYQHPMQKPTELYAISIRHHTQKGEVVAEPFAGSGTQFVAAEQLHRRCYGMEIEPKYVAVALQRMKNMGLEPILQKSR